MEEKPLQNKYWHQKKEIIQKSRTVNVTIRDPSRKNNHLSQFISPGSASPYDGWTLKSPKTKKITYWLIEGTSYMLDEIESKIVYKDEEYDR